MREFVDKFGRSLQVGQRVLHPNGWPCIIQELVEDGHGTKALIALEGEPASLHTLMCYEVQGVPEEETPVPPGPPVPIEDTPEPPPTTDAAPPREDASSVN